ncbi:unnamed protein product [Cylindrotheca closterium]|uniref:Uncharacterized protein n=1 Tax=Cylindrotheca closterium TaxID=2856 RepID=A0AAD2JHQ2_9STRA|nr:unnamed protein product [Cylindrotheca closterium]
MSSAETSSLRTLVNNENQPVERNELTDEEGRATTGTSRVSPSHGSPCSRRSLNVRELKEGEGTTKNRPSSLSRLSSRSRTSSRRLSDPSVSPLSTHRRRRSSSKRMSYSGEIVEGDDEEEVRKRASSFSRVSSLLEGGDYQQRPSSLSRLGSPRRSSSRRLSSSNLSSRRAIMHEQKPTSLPRLVSPRSRLVPKQLSAPSLLSADGRNSSGRASYSGEGTEGIEERQLNRRPASVARMSSPRKRPSRRISGSERPASLSRLSSPDRSPSGRRSASSSSRMYSPTRSASWQESNLSHSTRKSSRSRSGSRGRARSQRSLSRSSARSQRSMERSERSSSRSRSRTKQDQRSRRVPKKKPEPHRSRHDSPQHSCRHLGLHFEDASDSDDSMASNSPYRTSRKVSNLKILDDEQWGLQTVYSDDDDGFSDLDEEKRIAATHEQAFSGINVGKDGKNIESTVVRKTKPPSCKRQILCIVLAVLLLVAIGAGAAIVLGRRSSPSLAAITDTPIASPSNSTPPKQLTTIPPITFSPSSSPTRPLLYSPPSPEDCLSMANGNDVAGQDELFGRNFTIALRVAMLDESEISVLESRLQASLQEYLIPKLAECPSESRRLRQRNLALNRYAIGGGTVGIQCMDNRSCTSKESSDVCYSCLMSLELLLKDNSIRYLDIIGKISTSMLKEDVVKSSGLDDLLGMLATVGVELGSPTDTPSLIPSKAPSMKPSNFPSAAPSTDPTAKPISGSPTKSPTKAPTKRPTLSPSNSPTRNPTKSPTRQPTGNPTPGPTLPPTKQPTPGPTPSPTPVPLTPSPTFVTLRDDPLRDDDDAVPTSAPTSGPTVDLTSAPTSTPTSAATEKDDPPILLDDIFLFDENPTDDGTDDPFGGGGGDDGTITDVDGQFGGGGDDGTINDGDGTINDGDDLFGGGGTDNGVITDGDDLFEGGGGDDVTITDDGGFENGDDGVGDGGNNNLIFDDYFFPF